MNRLQMLGNAISSIRKSWDDVFLRNQPMPGDLDISDNPYTRSDLIYICITTTARAIAHVPGFIEKEVSKGVWEVDENNIWHNLFLKPNQYQDRYSFVEAIISYLMLDGDVYPFAYPNRQYPVLMFCATKKQIDPIKDKPSGNITGWRYNAKTSSSNIDLDFSDVAHLFYWNPKDPLSGLSPLEAGKMAYVSDYKAAVYNQLFFDQGASPGGVLSTPKTLNQPSFERLKLQMQERHHGNENAHKMMILDNDMKYSQTSLSQKDMEYYDLRKFNQARIFQIYGMKKIILSETSDLNLATAKEERKEWWRGTNLPTMRMIESAFENTILFGTGYRYRFDLTAVPALYEDFGDRVKTAVHLHRMGFTASQINQRLLLGFDDMPWHNTPYIASNLKPVFEEKEEESPNVPEDDDEDTGDDIDNDSDDDESSDESNDDENNSPDENDNNGDEDNVEESLTIISRSIEKSDSETWDQTINIALSFQHKFEKKVKKTFYKMRKTSLEALYQDTKDIQDLGDVLFIEEMQELRQQVNQIYREAIVSSVDNVADQLNMNIDFDLYDPVSVEFLAQKEIMIVRIGDTVRAQIRSNLQEAIENGDSIDDIARSLRDTFNFANNRARTIARTEVIGSTNFGRNQALRRTGFERKKWFTALDERVRTNHIDMHGQTAEMDGFWILPGGVTLRYPGDYLGPASEIINCRCIEIPVLN